MDPDACLSTMLESARAVLALLDDAGDRTLETVADELAQAVVDLDYWLTHDGAMPARWGGLR